MTVACRVICVTLLASLALTTGCGYSSGQLYRNGIETIHVEMFNTQEFRRDIEFQLTEAVKKRIGMNTPYRITSKAKADTILKGEVLEVRQAAFAPDFATRQPRDTQMTLAIRMQWQDLRDGRMLRDQPILLQAVDYLPPAGESEPFALQQAVDRMAWRIVTKLFDPDW